MLEVRKKIVTLGGAGGGEAGGKMVEKGRARYARRMKYELAQLIR